MAPRVDSVLQRLLREQKITPSRTSAGMVQKELEGGRSDLQEAKDSLGLGKYKWATVQAYYSSFHSARALLYAKNFREQSHRVYLPLSGNSTTGKSQSPCWKPSEMLWVCERRRTTGWSIQRMELELLLKRPKESLTRQAVFSGFGERRPPGKQ